VSSRRVGVFVLDSGNVPGVHQDLSPADVLVPAFWCSPETQRSIGAGGTLWPFADRLRKSYRSLVEQAYRQAEELQDALPAYHDAHPLLGWEGAIADALLLPTVGTWLHDTLAQELAPGTEVHFASRGPLADGFSQANEGHFVVQVGPTMTGPPDHRKSPARAAQSLLREVRRDYDYARLWFGPLEALDSRYLLRRRFVRRQDSRRDDVWCFSSYVNYSRALAHHARQFQTPPRWLVNGRSPRQGLPLEAKPVPLWAFRVDRTPDHEKTIRAARERAGHPAVRRLVDRNLPSLLAEIDLVEAFLSETRPSEIWVANQWGSESAVLQLARREQIPTVQVQHGILEQYFAFAPIRSDRFLVWGDFWRSLLPEEERPKVAVADPGGWSGGRNVGNERVTFFSQPLGTLPLADTTVFQREVVELLSRLRDRGMRIILRAHPQERLDDWVQAWARWGSGPAPTLDKRSPLEILLERTDVAITPLSTVMLPCIARGIPVVTLGWYEWLWSEPLRATGSISLAGSIDEAASLVEEGMREKAEQVGAAQILASVESTM
jgi:hypothetical protein